MRIDKLITVLKEIFGEDFKGYTQSPDELSIGIFNKVVEIEGYQSKETEEIIEEIKIKLNQ